MTRQATAPPQQAQAGDRERNRGPAPTAAPRRAAAAPGGAREDGLTGILARAVAARDGRALPDALHVGVERLSGLSMQDVRVSYDSPRPALLGARAYAHGREIHLAPGAERELPHEAWHVVQQKRGHVSATFDVAGRPANADPRLEREADRMGAAAARLGAQRPPARDQRSLEHVGDIARPVVQGRWLIDSPVSYFWEDEHGVDKDYDDLPAWLLQSFWERTGNDVPKPGSYVVGGRSRTHKLVYTLGEWAAMNNLGKQQAPRDVYNPFGRFTPSGTSSFIPSPRFALQGAAILEALRSNDNTFSDIQRKSDEQTAHGYPTHVEVTGGIVLQLVSEGEFGAAYADQAIPNDVAAHDPSKAGDPSVLKIVGSPEGYKLAENFKITPAELKAWSGVKRSASQAQVMGASAADAAENAGYDRNEGLGWEWLHLIAHSMGGVHGLGPQVSANLVAGTSECNTQMIIVEELIKDHVERSGGHAALWVGVDLLDPVRHIASRIGYDFELYNAKGEAVGVYHAEFFPLSRRRPAVIQNRSERYAIRAVHEGGGTAATTHVPRSQPTAHHGSRVPEQALDIAIDSTIASIDLSGARPPADVVNSLRIDMSIHPQLAQKEQDYAHRQVLYALGERLSPQGLQTHLPHVLRTFGDRGVGWVVYSYVVDHPQDKPAVLTQVLTPMYGEGRVPQTVSRFCV